VVTNVAAFGAFVDVGVHQDGLVHVSAMSRRFVSDPRDVVKSGEVVRVKVLEVDEARKRISLTLRLDDEPGAAGPARAEPGGGEQRGRGSRDGRPGARRDGQRGADRGGDPGAGRGGERGADRGRSGTGGDRRGADRRGGDRRGTPGRSPAPAANNAMADALRRAGFDVGGDRSGR
jgi:uncharacterized protein